MEGGGAGHYDKVLPTFQGWRKMPTFHWVSRTCVDSDGHRVSPAAETHFPTTQTGPSNHLSPSLRAHKTHSPLCEHEPSWWWALS